MPKFLCSDSEISLSGTEEIDKLAVYLCSEDASLITGTDVLIDGGWTAQ